MARGIGGSISEGLESGFRLGLDADAAAERKRANAVDEDLRRQTSARADQELGIRQNQDQRAGLNSNLDLLDRQEKTIRGRQNEIVGLSTAAQTAGTGVDPVLAQEYGQNANELARIRQRSLDFFSRAQSGQVDPLKVPPEEFYTNLVAATGMPLDELKQVPKHIADVQAGMQTNNPGLTVQGVNGLMAPQLRRGVGTPSPHGGVITRKEIIGLDPAVDNNHNPLPGKFMPRLRVYVSSPDNEESYYDAPMTVDGSSDGDDHVAVIDVPKAMNWLGNLGTMATAIQHPEVQARLAEGEKTAGGKTKQYLDQLTAISRPTTKGAMQERLNTIEQYARKYGISNEEAADKLRGLGVISAGNSLQQRLAQVDELDVPDDQKEKLRRDIALGAGGKTTGLIPQKPGKAAAAAGGAPAAVSNSTATGDDFLKTLPVGVAGIIKALDEGRMDIKSLSTKGGHREQMMALWNQYNPQANARNYGTGANIENAFAKGVEGRAVRSFNVAISHLDTLGQLAQALNNGNAQAVNKLGNYLSTQTGSAAPTNFEAAKHIVADEVIKAIVSSNGALADRETAAKQISAASSPAQLAGVINTFQDLMKGQLKGLSQQYYAGGGLKEFDTYLSPRTRELVGSLPRPGASSSGASTNAPKYQEGQTATGPGGKRMVFKGGTWQPL